jgi:hypothetical protein
MATVLMLHSIIRWVIIVVAVVGILKFLMGWLRGGSFAPLDRALASGFSGLMDLQALIGLLYFFVTGFGGIGFPAYRIGHALTMFTAVVIAHLPSMLKSPSDKVRFRTACLATLASLLLIVLGLSWL